jgi:hypothetical protein
MGLLAGLLTLPLAPVRGVMWIAETVGAEAQRQWRDPALVRAEIERVEQQHADGLLGDAQRDEQIDALVRRLLPSNGRPE